MNDKQHSLLNEIEHYSRLLSSKDDDGKRHALNYENSRKSMELEIEKLREELEIDFYRTENYKDNGIVKKLSRVEGLFLYRYITTFVSSKKNLT